MHHIQLQLWQSVCVIYYRTDWSLYIQLLRILHVLYV